MSIKIIVNFLIAFIICIICLQAKDVHIALATDANYLDHAGVAVSAAME